MTEFMRNLKLTKESSTIEKKCALQTVAMKFYYSYMSSHILKVKKSIESFNAKHELDPNMDEEIKSLRRVN